MLDDQASTATLKKTSTEYLGLRCFQYPYSESKIGYKNDLQVWNLIKDYPGKTNKKRLKKIWSVISRKPLYQLALGRGSIVVYSSIEVCIVLLFNQHLS